MGMSIAGVPGAARANVNTVIVTPAMVSVSIKNPASISATWQVNRTEAALTIARTTTSASAELRINGATVATFGGLLSQTGVILAPAASETLVFNETLVLTPALAKMISRAAPGTATITRVFTDTQTALPGAISLFATLGGAGDLAVRRIELSFENAARTDVVRQGDQLHAVADVSFNNNGVLRGEWRVVDASASLGGGGRRVLQVVRQQLVSSGEGRARIVSPPLPTKLSGLHLVSFSVQDTTTGFEIPILRYFVLQDNADKSGLAAANMDVIGPVNGASLEKDTVFSWPPIEGAHAYQVEIFKDNPVLPLTGKLVAGKNLTLSLQGLSLAHLQSGGTYQWHVRAFSKSGKVLGASTPRTINMP